MDTIALLSDLKMIQNVFNNKIKYSKQKSMVFNVYAADRLPKHKLNLTANNYFLIANHSPSSSSGTHWLAFFLTKKNNRNIVEYFDSYGFSPYSNKYFERFLRRYADKVIYNKKMLQSPFSTKCGKYCICYLHHKTTNKSLASFVQQFTTNFTENDKKIEKMYKQITKYSLNAQNNQTGGSCKVIKARKCIQTCCALMKKK